MLYVRCLQCSRQLRVPDHQAGQESVCPVCGTKFEAPSSDAVATAADPSRGGRAWQTEIVAEEGVPSLATASKRLSRLGPWRFISPSAMTLALLTLPLPWLEVRCQTSKTPSIHYTQTGAQMLVGRCTRLDNNTPAPANAPVARAQTGSLDSEHPARIVLIWLWLVAVLAALGTGLAARAFVPALMSLILSCISLKLLLALMVMVLLEELFHSVQFTPWPFVALVACFVATGGSFATLLLRLRTSRPVDS